MRQAASVRHRYRRLYTARHQRSQRRSHPIWRGLSLALIFVLAFGSSAFALSWSRFQNNIDQRDIQELLGAERPTRAAPGPKKESDPFAGQALNILVMGSDSREGDNEAVDRSGDSPGMRSDTTMIAHISADRSRVDIVSIPRDTLVDIPSCTLPDGSTTAPQRSAMFNSAFATGGSTGDVGAGAACTILAVEALTGLYIDDFVVVDFTGFVNVVDALGGVAMYIPEDINDRAADLRIEQGCRLLDGHQALGVARVRKTVGDGSDISRIGRQQDLVAAILQEVLSTNLLRNPARLYQVLDRGTQTLTTGDQIGDLSRIVGLGQSLASVRSENITFITMPFTWAGARVVPAEQYTAGVWDALRTDQPVDALVSGESGAIAVALRERQAAEEAAAATAAAAPTPPAADSASPGAPTPEPAPAPAPEEGPAACTKANAS